MSRVSNHRRAHGQFFTPALVVACCYDLLAGELAPGARIVDPACGDGAFLRAALERSLAPQEHLYGCDIDPALVAQLQGEGLARVALADGLDPDSQPAAAFDLVVGNPPFGVATSARGGRAQPSEVRFLLRALELARPGGYVALVLPSGVLANERLRAIRAAGPDDVAAMLKPPLYQPVDEQGSRTLYTAHYQPVEGRVTYYWPGESWPQSFGDFRPGSRTVSLDRAT